MPKTKRPTAAVRAKELGAKNLEQIATHIGASRSTLRLWNTTRPELFDAVVLGSLARMDGIKRFIGTNFPHPDTEG